VNSTRWFGAALVLPALSLLTSTLSLADSQNGFALMAGEIRVQGVLARTGDHPPKWLLRLEKPIRLDGKETNVIEVIEPSPGPTAPLGNGRHYEFTGRLDTDRDPPLLQVTTIRRLDGPAPTHKISQSTSASKH
jgi:hypothetical protein